MPWKILYESIIAHIFPGGCANQIVINIMLTLACYLACTIIQWNIDLLYLYDYRNNEACTIYVIFSIVYTWNKWSFAADKFQRKRYVYNCLNIWVQNISYVYLQVHNNKL